MPALTEWRVPPANQPRASDYGFDLDRALASVVGLHAIIPPDAFTADTLGVERAGNGVLIGDGLVLTVGYLITEAETIWLHLGDGRVVEGHALGFDFESGFGLVQALGRLGIPCDPYDEISMQAAMERAVEDVRVRERAAVEGPGWAATWSWDRTAAGLVDACFAAAAH